MKHALISCFLLLLAACDGPSNPKVAATEQLSELPKDDHSYSNLNQIRTKHLHLDLEVDFQSKKIYGIASHTMINNGADTAIFDIKGLQIQKVTLGKKGHEKETSFAIGPMDKDSIIGQALLVDVEPSTTKVNIYYQTTENSDALDWLDSSLTSSKNKPFLYTQGQAILTRTWIPCQDSPSNRITYSASVKVPADLMALMSARNPKKRALDGHYHFELTKPIPSYLIALAVGDIRYHAFSANSGVYAEKELIDACAREFVAIPKMIDAAEQLYGPYRWDQYDVLVLPYSFPFGGMENPMLTFANPTLITGDRSLVSVIAHELAHSWSGNLVTNHNWNDFWLNEGTTVYFENRIMEALYGKEIADILALVEFDELQDEIASMNQSAHPEDSKLHMELAGRDPDDAMTDVAYVKGAFFLKSLEAKVGRQKFDAFLKGYFAHFAFQTIDAIRFIDYLNADLLKKDKLSFNYNEWIYEKGLPKNCLQLESVRLNSMIQSAHLFAQGKLSFKPKYQYKTKRIHGRKRRVKTNIHTQYQDRIIQEWQLFIRNLPSDLSINKMRELDRDLHFSATGNSEVLTEWFILSAKTGYAVQIRPVLERFLVKVGRRKYVLPIYDALMQNPKTKHLASELFEKAKNNYHAVTRKSVAEIVK
ncbi:MAG: hypothetical protein RLZZ301_1090 [Bacteroidota bacterium]|jgi:aminopeptidase N